KQIKSAKNAFAQTVLKEDQLEEWKDFRRNSGQIDDPRLDKATALYYYFFSIGIGDIGISTLEPINESQIKILKRFRNVFDLAYRRYTDITRAEAQAREAQIELALERVRARTMAMQKSDELKEVVASVFDGMKSLGADPTVCNIALVDRKTCDTDVWTAHQTDNGMITYKVFISHFEHPFRKKLLDSFLNEIPFSVHELSGDLKKSYAQYLFEHVDYSKVPDEVTKSNEKLVNIEEGIVLSAAYMKYGLLIVSRSHAISIDESDILQRFAKIFEQTYTRFLDLQKAEAQAREAQIEAALERVRSRSMAMHKSEELADLSLELVKQVQVLGVATWFCAFNIYDDDPQGSLEWGSNGQGTFAKYRTPREDIFLRYYEAGQKGKTLLINEIGKEECPAHYKYLCTLPGVGEQLLKMKAAGIPFPTSQIDHVAFFKYGYVIFITYEPVPEAHDIFKRFAKVFEQTYTRFLDLQKAEAQAREGQIQLALEKVRMVALGLNKSEEMLQVAKALYEQLLELGFSNIRNAIIDIDNKDGETFTDYDYSHEMSGTITQMSYCDDPTLEGQFKKMADTTDDFFELKLEGKELQDLVNMRLKNGEAQDPRLLKIDLLTYNLFSFGNGAIGISNFGLLNEEEKSILNQFRNVFTFAYKRYTDLAAAEAQAREAKIEASMEKIRSSSLAMQKPEELIEVAELLRKEMGL
ncbi:MAG: hypothetical protein WBN42_01310, partial [Ignavibacteriaceae bacterium]